MMIHTQMGVPELEPEGGGIEDRSTPEVNVSCDRVLRLIVAWMKTQSEKRDRRRACQSERTVADGTRVAR